MCVPYSFCVTKKGEIISKQNVKHHTDLCEEFGLDYDAVLKPEFQIWNKKLKDMSETTTYVDGHGKAFYRIGDDGKFWLKNKFYDRVHRHIDDRFKTWKHGLEFIEQNWKICKPYVRSLCSTMPHYESNQELEQSIKEDVFENFNNRVSIEAVQGSLGCVYNVLYNDSDMDKTRVYVQQVDYQMILKGYLKSEDLKYMILNKARHKIVKDKAYDKYISLDLFKSHWSKEQNRVACWRN